MLLLGVVATGVAAPTGPAAAQVAGHAVAIDQPLGGRAEDPAADIPAAAPTSRAEFEGRRIDLSQGWEGARSCIVLGPTTVPDCFRTTEAADARVAILSSQAAASFSCATPLRLYENGGWWGRTLYFYSRGYWQNLGDYGFDNQLSSYIVGACWTYLAENNNGGGAWHPGSSAPGAAVPWMSLGWNDRVSSIYIT